MAQIFAPGVAMLRLVGVVGSNPQAQILHFYGGTTAAWSQAQINTLATSAFTSVSAHLAAQLGANVRYDYAEAVDLTDAVQRVAKTTAAPVPGTQVAPFLALGSSVMVNHHIGARYRGGHPRTYFPPPAVAFTNNGDTWTAAYVSAFQAAYDNFRDDILVALTAGGLGGAVQCAPRYTYSYTADANKHKFLKERTGFIGPFPISQSLVSDQVRTQRRRLGP
jgi:hypothetical protein